MTVSAAARERAIAAAAQRDEWLQLDAAARSERIKKCVTERVDDFVNHRAHNSARRAPCTIEAFEDGTPIESWQADRLTAADVLSINRRYYHAEMARELPHSDRWVAFLKADAALHPDRLPFFNMDRLFKTARILFVDTTREWEPAYDTLAEYDQLMISVDSLDTKQWPKGFQVDHDRWQDSLPRDLMAPNASYANGNRVPPKKRMQLHNSDKAADLAVEGGGLEARPDVGRGTSKLVKRRMLANMMVILRNRSDEVGEAMLAEMLQRAVRSDAIARYLAPLRDMVIEELKRRASQQRPSAIVKLVSGGNGAEVAEVVLPYIELVPATRLAATCKTLRDWCQTNGVKARLGVVPPPTADFDAADLDTMRTPSLEAGTRTHEVERNKYISLQPVVYYKRAFVNSEGVYESERVTAFEVANQRIVVNPKTVSPLGENTTTFNASLVHDDEARTPLLPYGGNKMVNIGFSEGVCPLSNKTAAIRKHELPLLKIAVSAADSKRWFNRRLRIRLQLNTVLKRSDGPPVAAPPLVCDSPAFVVVTREDSAFTKEQSRDRALENAQKRNIHKLSVRMEQSRESRERAAQQKLRDSAA